MSECPRTERAAWLVEQTNLNANWDIEVVPSELARTLERETASKDARIAELTAQAERRLAVIVEVKDAHDALCAFYAADIERGNDCLWIVRERAAIERTEKALTAARAEVEAAKGESNG